MTGTKAICLARLAGRTLAVLGLGIGVLNASAQTEAPVSTDIMSVEFIDSVRDMLSSPVVITAVKSRNAQRGELSSDDILELDNRWKQERETTGIQPQISASLGSPVSTYLLRQQAQSKGLYFDLFVMDHNGLNVGQSAVTSDFWQGDEDKFLKTFPYGPDAVFIDVPEYNDEVGAWFAQVNVTISDGGEAIGTGTVEVNLSELKRRSDLGL